MMKIRLQEWREELAVKWFMLDAQQKQAVVIVGVTLAQGIIDIIVAGITHRRKDSNSTKSSTE